MTGKQAGLSWWTRASNANLHWATGCRGRYVVELGAGNYWTIDHRRGLRGTKRRQLGTAHSLAAAKTIAQRDFDLVRGLVTRR